MRWRAEWSFRIHWKMERVLCPSMKETMTSSEMPPFILDWRAWTGKSAGRCRGCDASYWFLRQQDRLLPYRLWIAGGWSDHVDSGNVLATSTPKRTYQKSSRFCLVGLRALSS